ncbi:MAG TPA: hypothetical protein VHX88_15825 [Solirubrobacteraceae bacterium]|nr:hypothetical protein [Solirubrobacteraceae bacterium]
MAVLGALVLVCGWLGAGSARADDLYWANYLGDEGIAFANLAGGGGDLTITGASTAAALAVAPDPATNTIYWSTDDNTIDYASLDGGAGGPLTTTGATVGDPSGLAVDSATNKIYWTNATGGSTGEISYASLNGSGGGDLDTSGATVADPFGVAIDPATNKIYWANDDGEEISFANLDGTGGGGDLKTTGATVDYPNGVAIDPGTNKIYWSNSQDNTISFANLDDTGHGGELSTAGTSIDFPKGLAIDLATNEIYWANGNGNTISWANLDGSGGGDLDTTGASVSSPGYPAVLQAPMGTGVPLISGASTAGSALSCSQGAWSADLLPALDYLAPGGFAYAWDESGAPLAATSSTLTASTPGSYTCTVTASNHAGSTPQTSAPFTVTAAPVALPASPPASPPAGPDAAQITASLVALLAPHGRAARIAAVLAHGYRLSPSGLPAGTLVIDWYHLAKGAHLSKAKSKPKPVLVARGSASVASGRLTIRLTRAGRARLKHARHVTLTARGAFTRAGHPTITATKRFTLAR